MKYKNKVYAAWSKNADVRFNSSSGGLFSELAEAFINSGGVVYGAAFDEKFAVKHIRISKIEEIWKLRGSKYVASEMGDIYSLIKKDVESGQKVLFCGTPCQVAACKSVVNGDYNNLFCIDIICHGVASPKFWNDYVEAVQKKYDSKICNVNFRYKKPNWVTFSMKIEFENGKILVENKRDNIYLRAFLQDLISRPACHNCKFTTQKREGDLTIADFWGIKPQNESERNYDNGVSVCFLNSSKGEILFEKIKERVYYAEHDIQEAVDGNRCLRESYPPHSDRECFFRDYNLFGYEYVAKKYCYKEKVALRTRLREVERLQPLIDMYRRVRGYNG